VKASDPAPLSASDLIQRYGCQSDVSTEGSERVYAGLAPLSHAAQGFLCFLANEKYLHEALAAAKLACGLLCSLEHAAQIQEEFFKLGEPLVAQIFVHKEPYVTFARISQHFFRPHHPYEGVSPQAFVDASAQIASNVTIFPFAFVGPGARIEEGCVLYSGVFVGAGSVLGAQSLLYPNCVVREGCRLGERTILNPGAVIGGDGFGFAPTGMENVKIPQIGGVVLGDDVEVGANACIDRGALADTTVGKQTKIDSLVMVAHNVKIGDACFLAAQTGVAGSSQLGHRVTLAGQVGVSGHVSIGSQITVLAQAGVSKNLTEPGLYNGTPAKPNREHLLQMAAVNKLVPKRNKQNAASSVSKASSKEESPS
jgi:UDP-3-O-[3-hydroxymyristoyl] glucosamine N-acyltransferase